MFIKIARGAFLLALAVMIVSWVMTDGNTKPAEQEQQLSTYWIFT
jgi:hypothetical protein